MIDINETRDELLRAVKEILSKHAPEPSGETSEDDIEYANYILVFSSTLIELGYSLAANLEEEAARHILKLATERGETIFTNTQQLIKEKYYNFSSDSSFDDRSDEKVQVLKIKNNETDFSPDDNLDLSKMKPVGNA